MNTQQKIIAIIEAVREHATIYQAVKDPVTPPAYDGLVIEALRQGLSEKITAIMAK